MKQKRLLLIAFVLLFILPVAGSFIKWGGLPPGYGLFPAQKVLPDAPFSLPYFIAFGIIGLAIAAFLFFPYWFGFKRSQPAPLQKTATAFPRSFFPALIVMLVSWFLMWGRFGVISPADHFTFVPLWWGFIVVLDGIVYKRNNGVSLMSSRPGTVTIMAVVSAFSWFVFEFQNFFVIENWYYPNNKVFTNFGNISWQLLSYTTVLPAVFEWYWLLRTSDFWKSRYQQGPAIKFSKPLLYGALFSGFALSFLTACFPDELFWALWVGLLPVLVPAMTISGFWTPFTPIGRRGDWSAVILIALSTLFNGFFWEFWNFGSQHFHKDLPTNPNYWKYSVPYLDKFHLFSEMPILGYFGYLFFGVGCWVLWVSVAYLAGFNPALHDHDKTEEA